MNQFEKYIQEHGVIINDNILKVDSFLNHQIDPMLMKQMGDAFTEHFKDKGITKVVTLESSGIAPALFCALGLELPLVFIKKTSPSTMLDPVSATVHSFTKNKTYTVCMERTFLQEDDKVLFIDDFLANGEAFHGAEDLIKQCNAEIIGVGIVIEKAFQKGHDYIINNGYDFLALASIKDMKNNTITFVEE